MLLSKTTLRPARGGIGDMSSSLIQELFQGLCQFHLVGRQIQGPMDGLSFSPGVEALLGSTQFSHIQPIVLPQKVLFHLRSPQTMIQIVTILNLYCQITHWMGPQGGMLRVDGKRYMNLDPVHSTRHESNRQ